jgi:hypothetical protein
LIAASLVFLTPRGALLVLGVIVPLAALGLTRRRERRARTVLGLAEPRHTGITRRAVAITAVGALLALAASQPALRSTTRIDTRTDAQLLFVIDNSRSMLASHGPSAPTRIARARRDAISLRDRLLNVPAGVATMTDHVLPSLFPVADRETFDQTVRQAVQVGNPPPATQEVTATSLGALGALGTQSFFPPSATRRVAVVLTDGESRPFDVNQTAGALDRSPGVTPIFIRLGSAGESVFDPGGQPEASYHPDPAGAQAALTGLARAAGGKVFGENQVPAAARAVRAALGRGPSKAEAVKVSTTTLAPFFALAALVPLLVLLLEGVGARGLAGRMRRRGGNALETSPPANTESQPLPTRAAA